MINFSLPISAIIIIAIISIIIIDNAAWRWADE